MSASKVSQTIRDIASLKLQGASKIRQAAVAALLHLARQSTARTLPEFRQEITSAAFALSVSRPTEPGLQTLMRVMMTTLSDATTVSQARRNIIAKAARYEKDRKQTMQRIATYARTLLPHPATVLTHCHSHTVEAALVSSRRFLSQVICTETRPLFQGRITAQNLSKARIPVTSVVDSAAYSVLPFCDVFLTGADAVLSDGSVVNKIGTAPISLSAREFKKPHFVLTSTYSFDVLTMLGWPEPIEMRAGSEVWPNHPKAILVENPAFDVTPASQVKKIVCEDGIFAPSAFVRHMQKKFEVTRQHSELKAMVVRISGGLHD